MYDPNAVLRLKHIVGSKKEGIPPMLPVSEPILYKWIEEGRFPKATVLNKALHVWPYKEVVSAIEKLLAEGVQL